MSRHATPHPTLEAELERLREDNEALRFSSLKFGELAERLSERVRELEYLLGIRANASRATPRR